MVTLHIGRTQLNIHHNSFSALASLFGPNDISDHPFC